MSGTPPRPHTLTLTPRGAAVTIRAGRWLDAPVLALCEDETPEIRRTSQATGVVFPRLGSWMPRRARAEIHLDPSHAWRIEIRRGVGDLAADMRGLRLEEIDIDGGAARLQVDLPRPDRSIPITIRGGVKNTRLRRPGDVPVRLEVRGGARDLTLDECHMGALGGDTVLETSGGAGPRYEIDVSGGASALAVCALPPDARSQAPPAEL